jgi:hypothetical protein
MLSPCDLRQQLVRIGKEPGHHHEPLCDIKERTIQTTTSVRAIDRYHLEIVSERHILYRPTDCLMALVVALTALTRGAGNLRCRAAHGTFLRKDTLLCCILHPSHLLQHFDQPGAVVWRSNADRMETHICPGGYVEEYLERSQQHPCRQHLPAN